MNGRCSPPTTEQHPGQQTRVSSITPKVGEGLWATECQTLFGGNVLKKIVTFVPRMSKCKDVKFLENISTKQVYSLLATALLFTKPSQVPMPLTDVRQPQTTGSHKAHAQHLTPDPAWKPLWALLILTTILQKRAIVSPVYRKETDTQRVKMICLGRSCNWEGQSEDGAPGYECLTTAPHCPL